MLDWTPEDSKKLKVAIVHDWFEEFSGSEKVTSRICNLYPEAELFSLVDYMDEPTKKRFGNKKINTTFIQKLPFSRKHFRSYLPLFPMAIEQHDMTKFDLIIASSHNVAKGVQTNHNQLLICYCHSPIRYAWDFYHLYTQKYVKTKLKRVGAKIVLHYLRHWDYNAAQRVDYFISNSNFIKERIRKNYNRDSKVIYPPVETHKYAISDSIEDYYVTISRLVPYKNCDTIIKAFVENGKKLIVIGQGGELKKLKNIAKNSPNIEFKGFIIEKELIQVLSKAKAFVFAAEEDFGISPVEAQAAGVPVIAYGKGGVTETVIHNETGVLFKELSVVNLIKSIDHFEENEHLFDRKKIKEHAEKFSEERFTREMKAYIESCQIKRNNARSTS